MEFRKYNSLENVKQKLVTQIENHGYANEIYVVTEKIHGANFGIHLDNRTGEVKFSRRGDFLEEGENFYGFGGVLKAQLELAIIALGLKFPQMSTIRVYGELFGGKLEGHEALIPENVVNVQKEVQYSPNNEFMAFELVLNDMPQSFATVMDVLPNTGIKVVPVIGLAQDIYSALELPNDDNSIVPSVLGYEGPEENTKEGNVIVPWKSVLYFGNGKRVAIKNKNEKFSEKDTTKKVQKPVDLSEEATATLSLMVTYLTENRLSNVLSKEVADNLTGKDFGRIMGLLIQDAYEDFESDNGHKPKDLVVEEEWKVVSKRFSQEASNITREYFKEHIF